MDKKHSVREFYYSRVLGTKRKKSPSSLLEVQVGESASCPGLPWVIITVRKSNGPALRLNLIGHEAQDLGIALMTLGAKLSALQEDNALMRFPEGEFGKPTASEGSFHCDCREITDAS